MVNNFSYQCQANCSHSHARAGIFHTPHGTMETPTFMPVGTLANVKGVTPQQLREADSQMILANTYHLHLQPGESIVKQAGGLHKFMAWNGPILTDSGGFQVFSLGDIRTISENGVIFKSPKDGSMINITPEKSIEIQNALGADVIMAFDECPPGQATENVVKEATDRTLRWLKRCVNAHSRPQEQALFGIVQGGTYPQLREAAVKDLIDLELPGYAIGGVSVGEAPELINEIVAFTAPLLPEEKPRYLMGVGTYGEMAKAIASGIDMFDCVIPTRLGRHGAALVQGERWNLKNAPFKEDFRPLDETCNCYCCTNFSRAYLNHLVRAKEMLGFMLISVHNVTELVRFTRKIRNAIINDTFTKDFAQWL